jgi:hypothetical protein
MILKERFHMFKSMRLFCFALAFTASSPFVALAHDDEMGGHDEEAVGGAIVLTDSVTATATIVDVKKKEREITLRDEQGNEFSMIAGEEVRNFDRIKKGDIVVVEYHRAAATALEKLSDTNVASQTTDIARAPAGAKPGVAAMQTSSIVATVLEIDKEKRLLTVQGPRGGIVTVTVPADMKGFDSLKKGDKISAVMTEAVAISVRSPDKK